MTVDLPVRRDVQVDQRFFLMTCANGSFEWVLLNNLCHSDIKIIEANHNCCLFQFLYILRTCNTELLKSILAPN